MTKRIPAAALVAALGLLAGCSGGGSVSGKVTLDGNPLKSGTVTFHPVGAGPVAIGSIDSGGRYELAVGGDRSIPPGEYLVTVEATEASSSEATDPRKPPAPPKRLTPARYADRTRSGLRYTVKAGGNTIDVELAGGS